MVLESFSQLFESPSFFTKPFSAEPPFPTLSSFSGDIFQTVSLENVKAGTIEHNLLRLQGKRIIFKIRTNVFVPIFCGNVFLLLPRIEKLSQVSTTASSLNESPFHMYKSNCNPFSSLCSFFFLKNLSEKSGFHGNSRYRRRMVHHKCSLAFNCGHLAFRETHVRALIRKAWSLLF